MKCFSRKKLILIFVIFAQKINCGYIFEAPRRGDCNEYPQFTYVLIRNKKNRYTLSTPVVLYESGV